MACYMFCKGSRSVTLFCHRPSDEPDPVEFFLSLSENVGSPVPDELYNFTWTVCGLSGALFTYPACILCLCLKKAKQRSDRRGNPVENMPSRWRLFSKTHWDLSLGLFERGVFFRPIEKKNERCIFQKLRCCVNAEVTHENLLERVDKDQISIVKRTRNVSSVVPSSEWRFSFKRRHDTLSV